MTLPRLLFVPALAMALVGCSDPDACYESATGEHMRVGDNCLACHQPGFGDEAPTWTAAGTVFSDPEGTSCDGVEGVDVVLEAEDGSEVRATTNSVGNFWTDIPLKVDGYAYLEYEGRTEVMGRNLPETPACNYCHNDPPSGGAPGRIYAP